MANYIEARREELDLRRKRRKAGVPKGPAQPPRYARQRVKPTRGATPIRLGAQVEVGVMFDLAANADPRLNVGERRRVVSRLGRELAKGWRVA